MSRKKKAKRQPRSKPKTKQLSQGFAGYDATEAKPRRRSAANYTAHEDVHADERRRTILSSSARDLARNFAVAAYAIRKHLDFVADFVFEARTPDEGFNNEFEQWWAERSKKYNFDVAARHPHRRAVRLLEAGRVVDGDSFWMKLGNGPYRGMIQAIEGDRIITPRDATPREEWFNGVRLDLSTGRALAYAVCDRVGRTSKQLKRIVPAYNIIPHAAYEFRTDQVRGISPVAAALNQFRDTYEGFEFALAKLKTNQLFGLVITRADGGDGPISGSGSAEYTADSDGDGVNDSEPRIKLGKAPFISELDVGEDIKEVESKTPSSETVNFLKLMIHVALRSLDIPYSFFDESFTNFYGSRGGLMQYLHSCHNKILDLQDFMNEHARWRMGIAVADGDLKLPSGKDFDFLKWEFVPGGVPWWSPIDEARGQAMAIAMGITSPQRVCQETGTNLYDNIDQIAEAKAYAEKKGVPLVYADSTAFAPEIRVGAPDQT